MHKQRSGLKSTHGKPTNTKIATKTKTPLNVPKRTKMWKKMQRKKEDGVPKGLQTTKPGHLVQVLHDRKLVREHLTTYGQIVPRPEWHVLPCKANSWAIEETDPVPKELARRVLSYTDQFETPIRPKQIIHHFIEHPTSPAKKEHVYRTMKQLNSFGNLRKYYKVDEEGTVHWFVSTSRKSRVKHNYHLKNLIKGNHPLPLDEVVWETIEETADSWSNLRTMTHEQHMEFVKQKKLDDALAKAKNAV